MTMGPYGGIPRLLCAASLFVMALASCAARPSSEPPPGGLAAFVNSSAPSNDLSASQFCSGVLVSPTTVLTARHCVAGRALKDFHVQVGARNLCSTDVIDGERIVVVRVEFAPSGADLAIVALERAATTPPVPLRTSPEPIPGPIAWGWGTESEGGVPPCAATGKALKTVPNDQCDLPRDANPQDHLENYFCAIPSSGSNTCHGDSGGPVVAIDGGLTTLAGITASGRGCGPADPGLYVSASTIRGDLGHVP